MSTSEVPRRGDDLDLAAVRQRDPDRAGGAPAHGHLSAVRTAEEPEAGGGRDRKDGLQAASLQLADQRAEGLEGGTAPETHRVDQAVALGDHLPPEDALDRSGPERQ